MVSPRTHPERVVDRFDSGLRRCVPQIGTVLRSSLSPTGVGPADVAVPVGGVAHPAGLASPNAGSGEAAWLPSPDPVTTRGGGWVKHMAILVVIEAMN